MKKGLLIVALAAIAIVGCKKTPPYPPQPHPACCGGPTGAVMIEIKDSVPASRVFAQFIDSMGFTVRSMYGFNFNSALPADSVNAVRNYLLLRSYVSTASQIMLTGNAATPIHIRTYFSAIDAVQERDWLALYRQLQLQDINDSTKAVSVGVTPGREDSIAKVFEALPIVKRATVEYIAY